MKLAHKYETHERDVRRCIPKIRHSLLHMCRRYYYEHTDFENAITSSWAQLRMLDEELSMKLSDIYPGTDLGPMIGELKGTLERVDDDQPERARIVLHIIDCLRENGDTKDTEALADLLTTILTLPEKREETDLKKRKETDPEKRKETDLKIHQYHMQALCMQIEHTLPAPGRERFERFANLKSPPDGEQLKQQIEDGLNEIRTIMSESDDDQKQESFYFRYRARLLQSKGRLAWLADASEAGCREADRNFELARANIEAGDHRHLSILELYWAESLLVRGSRCLNDDEEPPDCNQAHMHYVRAGDALQRARNDLARGSQNVIWWFRYYQIWAQYQAEWCLWHVADLGSKIREKQTRTFAEEHSERIAAMVKRVKRGLTAIQSARALQRGGPAAQCLASSRDDPWLTRVSFELLGASILYGVTAIAAISHSDELLCFGSRPALSSCLEKLSSYWTHLNFQVGVPMEKEMEEELKRRFNEMREHILEHIQKEKCGLNPADEKWYEAICKAIEGGKDAMPLRRVALEAVNDMLSKNAPRA